MVQGGSVRCYCSLETAFNEKGGEILGIMRWVYKNPENVFYLDFFINPIPIFSMILMALNDHFLKFYYANWWTGKMSDFCGVFYFPLLLSALIILTGNLLIKVFAMSIRKGPIRLSKQIMFSSVLITALIMILIKLTEWGNHGMVFILNLLGTSNHIVMDATDLISLIMLIPSYQYAQHYFCNRYK